MKKVSENIKSKIVEKFSEIGDPVKDMGISVSEQYYEIEKILKQLKADYGGNYHITSSADFITGVYIQHPLKRQTRHVIKYEIPSKTYYQIFPTSAVGRGTMLTLDEPESFSSNVVHELIDGGYIDESVNEKFSDAPADPIKDMGIGESHKFEQALYDFIYKGFEGFWSDVRSIEPQKDTLVVVWTHDPYNDNFKYNISGALRSSKFDKYITSPADVKKYKTSTFGDEVFIKLKSEYTYILNAIEKITFKKLFLKGKFFKDKQMYTYEIKVIWRELFEKFIENSDPIEDMGIGVENKIFQISKEFYSFKSGYYSEKEWKKIIHWMLEEYEPWEVLACLDQKMMRYAYDNAGKSKATLNDFQNYNVKHMSDRQESEMDRLLNNYKLLHKEWVDHYQDIAKNAGIYTEPVHEKFTETGDPIKDMGIGIFKKKQYEDPRVAAKFVYSILPAILGRDEIPGDVIYEIGYRNEEGIRLAFNVEYLKNITDYLHEYVRPNTGEFLGHTLKQLHEILLIAGYPKDVNEKFTEKSDPVKDLEIGMMSVIKDFMKNEVEEYDDDDDATTDNKDIQLKYAVRYDKIDFIDYLISQGANINSEYIYSDLQSAAQNGWIEPIKIVIDRTPKPVMFIDRLFRIAAAHQNIDIVKYLVDNGANIHSEKDRAIQKAKASNSKELYAYFKTILDKENEEKHKQTKTKLRKFFGLKENITENINELFKEEPSDPIADMGIGGYTFETLKPGAVIKTKRIGIAVTKNQSGKFSGWHSGLKLFPQNNILIINVSPERKVIYNSNVQAYQPEYSNVYKDIIFKKFFMRDSPPYSADQDKKEYEEAREILKKGKIPHSGTTGRMIVSKKMFDYRFEVIEKGFDVNESVNEKFIEKSDPIQDMGIGLAHIIKDQVGCEEVESNGDGTFTAYFKQGFLPHPQKYSLNQVNNYYKEWIARCMYTLGRESKVRPLNNKSTNSIFAYKIIPFKKDNNALLKQHYVTEKFEEQSDPIHDMGIGIVGIREFDTLKEAAKTFVDYIHILTDGNFESKEHLKKVIIDSRRYTVPSGTPSSLRECKNYLEGIIGERKFDPLTIKELGERFDKQLSKLQFLKDFRDEVIRYALENTHVDEKFSEQSDPLEDMGIGIRVVIDEWLEENDEGEDVKGGYMTPAMFIVENHKDPEKVKSWIEFLLREGKEKIKDWEEGHVEDMKSAGVKFIPNSKVLPQEKMFYKIIDGEYYLYATEWGNFTNYFNIHGDIDEEFIGAVLEGDASRYFEYGYINQQLADLENSLSQDDEQKLFDYLKPICSEHAGEEIEANNIGELLDIVKEDIPEINEALLRAYSNSVAEAEEHAAYKDIVSTIKTQLHISEEKFNDNYLILKITEKGLNKLFVSWYLKDEGIEFWPPQYGWGGDFNLEYFIEDFENALE